MHGSPSHLRTKSKFFLWTSKALCGLSLLASPSSLHNTNAILLLKIPSISASQVQIYQVSFRNKNLEGLFNSASLSLSKCDSMTVSGSDHSYSSSSHGREKKKSKRVLSVHSIPCIRGEEHGSPLLFERWGQMAGLPCKGRRWWKCSLYSAPDSETWYKWETLTKSDFLRIIIVPISKCFLFKWLF